jgi:hypothetical protein
MNSLIRCEIHVAGQQTTVKQHVSRLMYDRVDFQSRVINCGTWNKLGVPPAVAFQAVLASTLGQDKPSHTGGILRLYSVIRT